MRLDQIVDFYISTIPKVPEHGNNYTGLQVLQSFQKLHSYYEVKPFNQKLFGSIFNKHSASQERLDWFDFKLSEINLLSQNLFEKESAAK